MLVNVSVHLDMYVCMGDAEVDTGCLPQSSSLFLGDKISCQNWTSLAGWPVSPRYLPNSFPFPGMGSQVTATMATVYVGVGNRTLSPHEKTSFKAF